MGLREDVVSAHEAADMLGITRSRVGMLCRQGRFNGATKIGVAWVVPRSAVLEFKRLPPGLKPRDACQEGTLFLDVALEGAQK